MQTAYSAFPYKTVQQWPPGAEYQAQYYAPQAAYPSAYANGGGGREHAYPDYQPWPQMATGNTPMPRPRKLEGRPNGSGNTPMPRPRQLPEKRNAPLKSAMRKVARTMSEPPAPQMQRTRTVSDPKRTLNPMTRTRTNSNPARDIPDHLFVTILGTSELRIQNANLHLVNDLRASMVAVWPYGVESESTNKDNTWHVNFMRNPWSATGTDAVLVLRMINQLFSVLNLSHNFMTTINVATIPRLTFALSYDPGEYVRHFVGYVSRNGRKLTLVDPPHQIGETIGAHMRAAWPHKIASDKAVDNGIYTVTLKSTNFGSYTIDKHLFMSFALQEIRVLGYKLLASVPLARRGPLGMGSKREVWIFKDMMHTRSRSKSGTSKQ